MDKQNQIKCVLIGNAGVGKSSIVQRFIQSTFSSNHDATIGAVFMSKGILVNEQTVKFQIWDTAGQERYHSLAKMYYRDAHAAIIVYDITSISSWGGVERWHEELKNSGSADLIIAVAGNKEDLVEQEVVDCGKAERFAKDIDAIYARTSAKEDIGIQKLFVDIAHKVFPNLAEKRKRETVKPEVQVEQPKKEKGGCC